MASKVREAAEATPSSSYPNPLISHDKLRQLYSMMLKCRLLDQRARMLRTQADFEDDRCFSVGLEATTVGAAIDLRPRDTLASSHPDFILSYLKGVPITIVFSQLYGRNTPLHNKQLDSDDCGYSPLDIVVPVSTFATQLNRCTDIAHANQRAKNDDIVMAFFDEDSISLNEWHHALNFAGQQNLSIVFVRHLNDLSAGSASAKPDSTGHDASSEAVEFGFPGIAVDGNDTVAVYRVAQEAIERARADGGPTLIEAHTFSGYRATDKVEQWKSGDPIFAMERYLMGKGLFSQDWKKKIVAAFQRELDAAVDAAEKDSCGVSA